MRRVHNDHKHGRERRPGVQCRGTGRGACTPRLSTVNRLCCRTACAVWRAPSFHIVLPFASNIVNSQTTTLTSLTPNGCGPAGPRGTASIGTGRCNQACTSPAQRQRGGTVGPVECRSGEWVDPATNLASGAVVCGAVCPAVTSLTADPSRCVHTVANVSFMTPTSGESMLGLVPYLEAVQGR